MIIDLLGKSWSGRFDRELKDIFAIQDEISRAIVNELRLKLGSGKRRYDTNLDAYELYLKAQPLLVQGGNSNQTKSVELFEQVIAKDPAFAPAYAGLAEGYATLSQNWVTGHIAPATANVKMRLAAEKAMELDPLLAEAHVAVGLVCTRDMDWASAEKAFRRAKELNPNLTSAKVYLAFWVLFATGRVEEAFREIDDASKADPLSPNLWGYRGLILINAGRYDEAIESSRRTLALGSSPAAKTTLARALVQKGSVAEAINILEQMEEGAGGHLGYAYAVTGRRAEAEALAARNDDFPRRLTLIYAGLGDKDRVFEALERMYSKKDPMVASYLSYPELALIRGDPRLAVFREKVGLQ